MEITSTDPKRDRAGYTNLLDSAEGKADRALGKCRWPEPIDVSLTTDELHVLLDAICSHRALIASVNDGESIGRGIGDPWNHY